MKYLKKFDNESDYQEFKDGENWMTPNLSAINSTNNIFFNKFIPLISFTVNGNEYQAEEGMTWEEFVNSDYNTNNGNKFSLNGASVFFKHGSSPRTEIYSNSQATTDGYVYSYDEIINEHSYYAVASGN